MAKKPLALDSFLASEAKQQITNSDNTEKRAGAKKEKSPVARTTTKTDKFKEKRIGQTVYLPPPVHRQLRALAFEEERKMHDYLMEGLDLVFRKRGLKSVADLNDAED